MNIWFIGDIHGSHSPVKTFYENYIENTSKEQEENWLIMLGDTGFNYCLDERDDHFKTRMSKYPFNYFVIRGNHEERASNCAKAHPEQWEEVECFGNTCLRQPAYPNIYYANDAGDIYYIRGRRTLVIPGAYSVDKPWRLSQGWRWFPDEQLTAQELARLERMAAGRHFDLVLSHTCPYTYRPTDLFLNCIDQSGVDSSMELWMDQLDEKITYNAWCWGHYHADRVEAPHCEMFFQEVQSLEAVEERWHRYYETGELDWWIPKAPNFYIYTE